MASLLEALASEYDVVLIDTPALLPAADAAILATITGGALVVAVAGLLHRQQLADGLGSLQDVGARVLCVVLNRLARQQDNVYSYNDYAAGPRLGVRDRSRRLRAAASDPAPAPPTRVDTRRSSLRSGLGGSTVTGRAAVPVSGTDEDDPLALTAAGVDTEK